MIDTIIFDIGKVLVEFRWETLFRELGFEGDAFESIANATVKNPIWEEFDRGTYTHDEMFALFVEQAPEYEPQIKILFDNFGGIVKLFDYAIPWIRELKASGYKVYVLSNWPESVYHASLDGALSFLPELDGAVMSFQEKLIKPDPQIFERLCRRYSIEPQNAVFLDDTLKNVESARAFGLHAIHFQSYEQAREQLAAYI